MEILEKSKIKVDIESLRALSLEDLVIFDLKTPQGSSSGKPKKIKLGDVTVYACDANCDNCHCATYGE